MATNIDCFIKDFIIRKQSGINNLYNLYYKYDLSFDSFIEKVCIFIKNENINFNLSEEELDLQLFYIVNEFCKKNQKVKNKYLCPGCLFLGKKVKLTLNKFFNCQLCYDKLKNNSDPKQKLLFETFCNHSKNGYACQDCKRFIPLPLNNSLNVSCPYFDCCWVGNISSLKRKNHPSSIEAETPLLKKEDNSDIFFSLKEIIESQSNAVAYNSAEFTIKHKTFVYQAFLNLLNKYPKDMIAYLVDDSRTGGFQHKIFQEYVSLLDNSLPISFKKNNTIFKIESLLDKNLCLFDGISTFETTINNKFEIKNNTSEFYIGGRKATYAKPYYIGKLLDIVSKDDLKSLMHCVTEYSFSKITLNNVIANTPVIVTHLRIPPHYQMGGMVYVNRIKKKISDQAKLIL